MRSQLRAHFYFGRSLMSPQERDIIAEIFNRLKGAENAPRDAEAERFIAELIARQPYAPYVLAQSVYAQEQAVNGLAMQVEQLKAELAAAKTAPAPAPAQSGGFLSGIFGNGASQAAAPAARPSGPWGSAPVAQSQQQPQYAPQQQAAPPSRGGGFLAQAATTAAGVAGGMMVANALGGMFGGNKQAAAPQTPQNASHEQASTPANQSDSFFGGNGQDTGEEYGENYSDNSGGGDDWA
jgi:uncharacterized protein